MHFKSWDMGQKSSLYLEQVVLMADGTQQVTELNYTISLNAFGLALAYECESYLLVFHWPKHVMCPSLSEMGRAAPLLGGQAVLQFTCN